MFLTFRSVKALQTRETGKLVDESETGNSQFIFRMLECMHPSDRESFTCVVLEADRHQRLIGISVGRDNRHLSVCRIRQAPSVSVSIDNVRFVRALLLRRTLESVQDIKHRQRHRRSPRMVPITGIPCGENGGFEGWIRDVADYWWTVAFSNGFIGRRGREEAVRERSDCLGSLDDACLAGFGVADERTDNAEIMFVLFVRQEQWPRDERT